MHRLVLCLTASLFLSHLFLVPSVSLAQDTRFAVVVAHELCAKAQELGVGYVRLDMHWDEMEGTPGSIDWSFWKSKVECFTNAGIRVYSVLGDSPSWANGGNDKRHLPDPTLWRAHVRDVISQFSYLGDMITFGVWNEPESNAFLTGCSESSPARAYCYLNNLFYPAVAARDEVNPNARLAGPDMGIPDGAFEVAVGYMNQVMRPQDVITTHWYPDFDNYGGSLWNWMFHAVYTVAGGRETWLTETGSKDCSDSAHANETHSIAATFVTSGIPAWTKMFIYHLRNENVCESLVRADGSNRAGFYAYRFFFELPPPAFYTISIQADNGQYVVAEDNGGGTINANRDNIGPWETFSLSDVNSGELMDGDLVSVQTGGGPYFQAVSGGGGTLEAIGGGPNTWETFRVHLLSGGDSRVDSGDLIALETANGHYVVAEGGGGDVVNANRVAIGPWETFRIIIH